MTGKCQHDTDAAGNCKYRCGYNSEAAREAAIARGEDVYGYVPDLPAPNGYDDDGAPWWRLSSGERVFSVAGSVYTPERCDDLGRVEEDALARLAAVAHARSVAS